MSVTSSQLYFNDGGSGETPVFFLHSLAGTANHWLAQLDSIRGGYRAIAIDFSGHGRSKKQIGSENHLESFIQDVEDVANHLQLQKFVLVGHSMGGAIATAFAARHPEQVTALLLVDPAGDSTQMPPAVVQQIIGAMASLGYQEYIEGYWQQILAGSTDATHTAVMRDLRQTPTDVVIQILEELLQHNSLPDFKKFTGPKMIVAPSSTESPVSLHKLDPTVPSKIIDDASHWLQLDQPEVFNQILADFLQSV